MTTFAQYREAVELAMRERRGLREGEGGGGGLGEGAAFLQGVAGGGAGVCSPASSLRRTTRSTTTASCPVSWCASRRSSAEAHATPRRSGLQRGAPTA